MHIIISEALLVFSNKGGGELPLDAACFIIMLVNPI